MNSNQSVNVKCSHLASWHIFQVSLCGSFNKPQVSDLFSVFPTSLFVVQRAGSQLSSLFCAFLMGSTSIRVRLGRDGSPYETEGKTGIARTEPERVGIVRGGE